VLDFARWVRTLETRPRGAGRILLLRRWSACRDRFLRSGWHGWTLQWL